ncbi:MAG: hypothetical protein HYX94_04700 [Chloroflexi bacterium]|nr:hypothetical protein [Chloroflexota bacterium]
MTPLEPEAIEEMARGILGGAVATDLASLLNARAGGTPLFVEALIAALKDSGRLVYRNGVWQLAGERAIGVPRSIKRLILERLSRLVPAERRVLDLIAGFCCIMNPYSGEAGILERGNVAKLDECGRFRRAELVSQIPRLPRVTGRESKMAQPCG